MGRSQRVCKICGNPFYGSRDQFYCPDCAKKLKSNVIRARTCKMCGKQFEGGPRAMYCPDCRVVRRKEMLRIHRQNGGTRRPLGSVDICQWCNSEYTVVSGRQKYCSEKCSREATLQWQKEHKKGYALISGQYEKKSERRRDWVGICEYCGRHFHPSESTSFCSEYCRKKQAQINQCNFDINRGYSRDLQGLLDSRDKYRKSVSGQTDTK